jgi:hypothetical protein
MRIVQTVPRGDSASRVGAVALAAPAKKKWQIHHHSLAWDDSTCSCDAQLDGGPACDAKRLKRAAGMRFEFFRPLWHRIW